MSIEPTDALPLSKPGTAAPGLYVAATPIGNLGDITLRALEVMRHANVIACEDSRITARLLARYAITTPRISYHEHNAKRMLPKIIARLLAGECVVLVSDAGTPLISDPGYRLVRAALEAGTVAVIAGGIGAIVTVALWARIFPVLRTTRTFDPPEELLEKPTTETPEEKLQERIP